MNYYKNGNQLICTIGKLDLPEITAEEYEAEMAVVNKRMEKHAKIAEKSRPLTEAEVNHLFIQQNIQTIITDDALASRAVEFHPEMQYNGKLIPAKTRINWNGKLKRTTVDVWDTEANNPDNAPNLWEDIAYRDGFRIIPKDITATLAFANGEIGWWGDILKRSKRDGNVHNPDVAPDWWEDVYPDNWEDYTL